MTIRMIVWASSKVSDIIQYACPGAVKVGCNLFIYKF